MKKLLGASLISGMLILGQPFLAFADTTGSRTINFEDIRGIIAEQNINIQINQNDRLKSKVGYADLKSTINDLEDDLENVERDRDALRGVPDATGQIVAKIAEKRMLLDTLKQLEEDVVDQPINEAIADISASINDDLEIRTAEGMYIAYNQLKLTSLDISTGIKTSQKRLAAMQLQESLGMISQNDMNNLNTELVNMQTTLESIKFQQDALQRQLTNLLNEQENILVIGAIPSEEKDLNNQDVEADLKKALENSYTIKLQEQVIVNLNNALERAKKDKGMTSNQYKLINYDLTNANLKLTQQKDTLKSDYYTLIDDIAKIQSDLRLEEQNLGDKRVALYEAQIRMGLGLISKLEMDSVIAGYQVQENAVKTKEIALFNVKCGYDWFLQGMPRS